MGGLVLDIYVAYLLRYTINLFKRIRSVCWASNLCNVTRAFWRRPDCGCDVAKVMYRYLVNGKVYRSTYIEPFLMGGNRNGPVKVLSPGTFLQIRYDPNDPTRSVLVEPWWITRRPVESKG
jgi:hypothetical protein